MSLTTKRQLPNINNEKIRQLNSVLINTEDKIRNVQQNFESFKQTTSLVDKFRNNGSKSIIQKNKGDHFNNDDSKQSILSNEHEKFKHEISKITKQKLSSKSSNDSIISSKQDSIVQEVTHSRYDRRLQEIEREIQQHREEQQQKLSTSIYNEDDKILQAHSISNKQIYEFPLQNTKRQLEDNEIHKNSLTQQNSATLLDCAKLIRENVTQFKNQLMKNESAHEKQIQSVEELSSLLNRRRRTEQDHLQMENEYLIKQQTMLSKAATLNEMLNFKKELEKSERQREELSYELESLIKTCDEKDKLMSKTLLEFKEVTENCDTFERQNTKLQYDLTLALEKLEEMTEEAERFAKESTNSQKLLADSEQKREESQIQADEIIKQWKARVKKFEKDIDRYKLDSTQMLEKNEQLIKEINIFKSQELTLNEQNTKLETDLNQANTNYNQLEEQFKRNENDIIQLCAIRSSQEVDIATLKGTVYELEKQLCIQRQCQLKTEKEKQNLHQLLQEETNHRHNLDSKLKQSEKDIETLNTSHSQLQQQIIEFENERINLLQKVKEIEFERDSLSKEKTKFLSLENDYDEIKRKLEITKVDYTHGMKALQMDYENKIEIFQLQLSDETSRIAILQRHELDHKQEIERLQEKAAKFEDETTRAYCTIEILSREINDKSRLIDELESKINKLTIETTNQRNQIIKKENDYQNSLQTIYNEIIYCTECLSNDSNEPFVIIESATIPRDDMEVWFSKFKAHLTWLKQELEIRQQQEKKLRQDLDNALIDCEADRKYFASELAKREVIINDLTNNHQDCEQETLNTTNEYKQFDTQIKYNKPRIFTEDEHDRIDDRYRQFQIMVDSVKRELHTAKLQLSS
ncbi:unnamed protein product [Rotaria sordida]|uniref:Uncharacterized protein n=1 Tax=Rotaria sordida TaxID=392033 RepID=A0A813QM35_9BILA|nr:unnamed protein product [Rotaria sordida]CAF0768524.1 unnamed protein product [Rotaria sordida]